MKCSKCLKEFEDNKIDLSHDVPCYLFFGVSRNERKNKADKFDRRYLCHNCHRLYEKILRKHLQLKALEFSSKYFKEDNNGK